MKFNGYLCSRSDERKMELLLYKSPPILFGSVTVVQKANISSILIHRLMDFIDQSLTDGRLLKQSGRGSLLCRGM